MDTLNYTYACYNATSERPCSPYAQCSRYDDSQCGYLYSTADQVGFCQVTDPPLWPPLVQVPSNQYRGPKYPEIDPDGIPQPVNLAANSTSMLYTAADPTVGAQLMVSMWARDQSITAAATAAYFKAQAEGRSIPDSTVNQTIANESDFVEATGSLTRGLYEFGLVMGKLTPSRYILSSVFVHMLSTFRHISRP